MDEKKKRMRFLYNETASHYNARYLEIQQTKYSRILEKLKVRGRILDLGGGSGMFSELTGFLTDTLDISDQLLRVGIKNVGEGNWIAADGENLPFRDGAYDTVVSFSALQNYPNRKRGVLEILRILCKGGKFGLTALSKTLPETELKSLLKETEFDLVDVMIEDVGAVGRKR